MKKRIVFEIDEAVADKAEKIYLSLGMDTEMALGLFMRRTVLENKLPLDMTAAATVSPSATDSLYGVPESERILTDRVKTRTNGKITRSMVERVWDEFHSFIQSGGDIREIADDVADSTGMNPGSAFIYLTILNNLVKGNPNKRNMKMGDLEFYMEKIRDVLGGAEFQNALISLEESVPYWDDKDRFGFFGSQVSNYVREIKEQGQ